jgi:hypothetical protein
MGIPFVNSFSKLTKNEPQVNSAAACSSGYYIAKIMQIATTLTNHHFFPYPPGLTTPVKIATTSVTQTLAR